MGDYSLHTMANRKDVELEPTKSKGVRWKQLSEYSEIGQKEECYWPKSSRNMPIVLM